MRSILRDGENSGAESLPKVAIVVLNWNGWRDTIECLESLQRLNYPNYMIVVVDNGSTDGSVEKIKSWARGEITVESEFLRDTFSPKPVRWVEYDRSTAVEGGVQDAEAYLERFPPSGRMVLIRIEENLGFAAGNNVGIRYALKKDYPYVGLLNNDTVVDPDYLSRLVLTLKEYSVYMGACPKILFKDGVARIWYAGAKFSLWRASVSNIGFRKADGPDWCGVKPSGHLTGCAFVARRELFQELGLLDEDYFFCHEDSAYSLRARKYGFAFCICLDSKVYHKWGGTLRKGGRANAYYSNKYRLVLLKKEASLGERLAGYSFYGLSRFAKFFLLLLFGRADLILAEIEAIRDFLLNRWGDYDRKRTNSGVIGIKYIGT